jgi:glutamyl-tRNA synthetase
VLALLARLGTSDAVEPVTSAETLVAGIDFTRFGRAPARFDLDELKGLNAKTLHMLPFDAVATRLPEGMDAAAWSAVRPNLEKFSQAAEWWQVIEGLVASAPAPEDAAFLRSAARVAGAIDWSANPWGALTAGLKAETGRSGKALFLPLRRALTGRDHGPDMTTLLPLIGKKRALERLG